MLNNETIKDTLWSSGRNDFAETGSVWPPVRAGGPLLWGQDRGNEEDYWHGAWPQPDPCAPVDQGAGPNPARPGECILDSDLTPSSTFTSFSCQECQTCGRFPEQHWGP
jgi:hypothetical protein